MRPDRFVDEAGESRQREQRIQRARHAQCSTTSCRERVPWYSFTSRR
jgi:hypothetical protein